MSAGEIEQQSMNQWLAQSDLPLNLGHDLLSRYLLQTGKRMGEEVDIELLKTVAMSGFCAGRADRIFSEGERDLRLRGDAYIDPILDSEHLYNVKAALIWGYAQGQRGAEGLRFS